MVQAAKQLMRERGYHATAFSDVLRLSGAPRGSVYFHFPDGKTQLATEAAEAHAYEQVEIIDRAAEQATSAAELVERYLDLGRDGMVASGYARGCAIAPLVTEGATRDSAEVGETGRRTFSEMIDRLAFHFITFGVEQAAARSLADAVIAGVEGAMITSRARHSPAPYDAVKLTLADFATRAPRSRRARR
ncbi:TetR/AcrR family transcriptional regulator [Amycolatopsis sp. NPDC005961]|uniref:TetR/AcrR family transcriptional regulator n=1 Tax=Amycolatopsis sp. NPDC005961 TaxID=3156720 RepID=UPI0033C0F221